VTWFRRLRRASRDPPYGVASIVAVLALAAVLVVQGRWTTALLLVGLLPATWLVMYAIVLRPDVLSGHGGPRWNPGLARSAQSTG